MDNFRHNSVFKVHVVGVGMMGISDYYYLGSNAMKDPVIVINDESLFIFQG